jgi:DNA-binding beta-propeller fold protein YncE
MRKRSRSLAWRRRMRRVALSLLAVVWLLPGRGTAQGTTVLVEEYRFGAFSSAAHLSVDPFGGIYVSDPGSHTVRKFDSTGTLLVTAGGQGWDLTQFDHPAGLDARLGLAVYIADRGNHRVLRCDRLLNAIGVFAPRENAGSGTDFGTPRDVAISRQGTLFIVDGDNARIVSTAGFATIENRFGGMDAGAGKLHEPLALGLDDEENLYVLEPDRVVVFDVYGNYRMQFGNGGFTEPRGIRVFGDRVAVVTPDTVHVFAIDGTPRQQFAPQHFIFSAPAEEFRDILWTDNRVLLLTARDVIILAPRTVP